MLERGIQAALKNLHVIPEIALLGETHLNVMVKGKRPMCFKRNQKVQIIATFELSPEEKETHPPPEKKWKWNYLQQNVIVIYR